MGWGRGGGGVQKASKKRIKQTEEEHWKVKKKTRRIQGKSYFSQKHNLKKVVYTIEFYLQFSRVAGCLKHSNDHIHNSNDKYTNYNIIEIYINRLSTTTQIFIAIDYLIMMSEKYFILEK